MSGLASLIALVACVAPAQGKPVGAMPAGRVMMPMAMPRGAMPAAAPRAHMPGGIVPRVQHPHGPLHHRSVHHGPLRHVAPGTTRIAPPSFGPSPRIIIVGRHGGHGHFRAHHGQPSPGRIVRPGVIDMRPEHQVVSPRVMRRFAVLHANEARGLRGGRLAPISAGTPHLTRDAFSGPRARRLVAHAALHGHHSHKHRYGKHRRWGFAGLYWPGPYFWPYAYYDDAFWVGPSAYDAAFWSYDLDDAMHAALAPAPAPAGQLIRVPQGTPRQQTHAATDGAAPDAAAPPPDPLCGKPPSGLTDWPVADLATRLSLTDEQRPALDAVKRASERAAEVLRAGCPREAALTPPGRLDAAYQQLEALRDAVRLVRPALAVLSIQLDEAQRSRFDALGQKDASRERTALTQICARQPGLSDLPFERIAQAVRPNAEQRVALDALRAAATRAAESIRQTCPAEIPLAPVARLEAIEQRITALLAALDLVRPALAGFYGQLSDEQKARVNSLRASRTS